MADRLVCSVGHSGGAGPSLKLLVSPEVQRVHFNPRRGTITLVLDGIEVEVNIAKKDFWANTSGELIKRELGEYIERHHLKRGQRVWLREIQPGALFAVERE